MKLKKQRTISLIITLFVISSLMIFTREAITPIQKPVRSAENSLVEYPLAKPITQGSLRVHSHFLIANDITPPVISNVQVTGISATSATITWNTDEDSTSVVNYGTNPALKNTKTDTSLVTTHSVTLTVLVPDKTYLFEVESTDGSGNTAIDDNSGDHYTFTTTPASDTTPPVISNVQVPGISATSATITWNTDEDSTSVVNYGTNPAIQNIEADTSLVTTHSVTLKGLAPNTTYLFEVKSTDGSENTAIDNNSGSHYKFTTAPASDTTPPIISVVQVPEISTSNATITWTTDEDSTSIVNYGTNPALKNTKSDTSLVTTHSVTLTGLAPNTTYLFEVESTDISGNTAIDNDNGYYYTFTTPPLPDTTAPIIQNIDAIPEVYGATIVWQTDEPSTSKVEYGETGPPFVQKVEETSLTVIHSLYIADLEAETKYHFLIYSTDKVGNTAIYPETGSLSFTTEAPANTSLHFTSNSRSTETNTVEIDRTYTTWVEFLDNNNGGNPINGATIEIMDSEGAVSQKYIQSEDSGVYRVELTPAKIGHFSLKITASIEAFDSASGTLILDILPIETDLYFVSNYQAKELASIQINEMYTTIVQFNRTSTTPETPINDATLSVTSPDPGISHTVASLGNGRYQITVRAEQSKQVSIVIAASKTLYKSDSVTLVLISGLIETRLRFNSTLQSMETGTVNVYKIYTTWVQLYATALSHEMPINDGTIEMRSSSPNLSYSVTPFGNGFYQIEISSTIVSQLNIDLEASTGPKYLNATALLTLIVEPIPTELRLINDPKIVDNRLSLIYTEPIEINVLYTDENAEGLNFAHFEWEADGLDFQAWKEGREVGEYIFNFEASAPGIYPLTLTLSKPNYANASLITVILVNPIPVANIRDDVNVIEGTDSKKLTIELRNEVDGSPITGAIVTYSMEGSDISGVMKDLGNGIYVADLSGEKLDMGNYTFEIVAEKANHVSLVIEYSLIVHEPPSFIKNYWMYLSVVGCLILGSTTHYIVKERKKRKRTLLEAKKRITLEYLTDIAHFEDLLVITSNGVPFYSFTESISPKGIDPALYSSFLLALNAFAEESLDQVNKEDHIRFGGSEIFLHSIRELIFVYIFSAQPKIEDWKKVSHGVLKRCRELTNQIEHDFHNIIREFEKFKIARIVPKPLIMDVITKVLGLDFVFPHLIKNLKLHNKVSLIDESFILKTIDQLGSKEGIINIFQVLEWLKSTNISSDTIIFTFHQLRKEGAIIPVGRREQEAWKPLSILEKSLEETRTTPVDLEESLSILEESLEETRTTPIDLEENLSILEESSQESWTTLINNPRDILSLLEKLRSILIDSKDYY